MSPTTRGLVSISASLSQACGEDEVINDCDYVDADVTDILHKSREYFPTQISVSLLRVHSLSTSPPKRAFLQMVFGDLSINLLAPQTPPNVWFHELVQSLTVLGTFFT